MKKTILDALKAKFEGVSEAVLERIAEKLAKTVKTEEQVATAVEGVTLQQVIDSYGDSRATEATKTAVKNYETKHGLKDGVKVTGGEPEIKIEPKGGDENVPEWAKALIESNKALNDRLTKFEGDRTSESRKQKLSTIIGKLPEKLRKAYERIPLDNLSEDEFNTLQGEIEGEVNAIVSESRTKGAVFGRPSSPATKTSSQPDKEATDDEAQAVVDKLSI